MAKIAYMFLLVLMFSLIQGTEKSYYAIIKSCAG